MPDTESENGSATEQPGTPVNIPQVTPGGGDPEPQEPAVEEQSPADQEEDQQAQGVLPVDQVCALTSEMAEEIGVRFAQLFPGQLAEIDAQRDRSLYLQGARNGWRVDLVLRVRLRRG